MSYQSIHLRKDGKYQYSIRDDLLHGELNSDSDFYSFVTDYLGITETMVVKM